MDLKTSAVIETTGLTITHGEIEAGQRFGVSILVNNTGDTSAIYELALRINGNIVDERKIELSANTRQLVAFSSEINEEGIYDISVAGLTGKLTVKPKTSQKFVHVNGNIAEMTTNLESLNAPMPSTGENRLLLAVIIGIALGLTAAIIGLVFWRRKKLLTVE